MKKFAILFATLIIMSIVMSSCSSGNRCAAYGESYKYQKSHNY